jgi:hypothetical protein
MAMLSLTSISDVHEVSRTVDEYVPLRLEFSPSLRGMDEMLYWRSRGKFYLLEIKLDASNGRLAEVTVVLVPRSSVVRRESVIASSDTEFSQEGVPHFDLTPWFERTAKRETMDPSLRRIDEDHPFTLVVAKDGAEIWFDESAPRAKCIRAKDVCIYFGSKGELTGIVTLGLTHAELRTLSSFA